MIPLVQERKYVRLFLLVCSAPILYFTFRTFQSFILPVSLAVILASLSYPFFEWTVIKLRGRRSLAALVTCLGVTASIIMPLSILLFMLAGEVAQVYQKLQLALKQGVLLELLDWERSPYFGPLGNWISGYLNLGTINFTENFTSTFQQVSYFFLRHSTAMVSSLFHTITSFLVMLLTMFFLFRDGPSLKEELRSWSPLSEHYEQRIILKFREVTSATVLGNLLTSLSQGLAAGLIYWILGMPNLLFWSFATALFSLVPVIGTALVWAPWAAYFFLTGSSVKGFLLVILSVVLVGTIDNVVRPLYIEGKAKMHTLVVFFAIMGGIGYFGILGMIFGPIVVAIGLTFVELYKMEFNQELVKPDD